MPKMIKYTLTCDDKTADKSKLVAAAAVLEFKKLELIAAASVIAAKNKKTT